MIDIEMHPGEILAKQLQNYKMSSAELGRQLQVPTNRITSIIKGQRSITGDTALRLGHFFCMSPTFWLELQNNYDLAVAKHKSGQLIKKLPKLTVNGNLQITLEDIK